MKRKVEMMNTLLVTEKIEEYGLESFSDSDLLKMAVGDNESVFSDALAQDIGNAFDTATSFNDAFSKLTRVSNLTLEKAIALSAMIEFSRRRTHGNKKSLVKPNDVYEAIRHYASSEQERFIVVGVNGANEIVFSKVITIGTLDSAPIHPRETFSDAIKNRCKSIFIAHNHPSGYLSPSEPDVLTTLRLVKAGELLGIKVLDHIIFSDKDFYSMKEQGDME